ncbi:MAG TPA: lysophospholipid acyltransferase family protein [Chthonomonadales bacterium]|nr:lysophospholipid acyltransferase family protein [Chthonomonadales bacterium]
MTSTGAWRPPRRPWHNLFYHVAGMGTRLLFGFFGRLRVIGLENVPKTGGVILAANHASFIDPPLVGGILQNYRRVWIMAKSELWGYPIVAWILNRTMSFPVHRGVADRATLRMILDWLAEGYGVFMFPEGERSRTGKLNPAQPGLGLLVHRSGVPVVPIAIVGATRMMPVGARFPVPARLTVAFGVPLHFDAAAHRDEIGPKVMTAIADLMTQNGEPTAPPVEAVPGEKEAVTADRKKPAGAANE